jgi:tRNA threonylcarbamoyladenosine biosynthesis protein TsaB
MERVSVLVLGIDTASAVNSVALVAEAGVVAALVIRQGVGLARPLLHSIDRLFDWTGYTLADLCGIAVNIGPGAFTGLRVGLATAQGLAMASAKPLVGCSMFEALIACVPGWEGNICPVLDARKGEVYAALYYQSARQPRQVMAGIAVTPEALCALITERTLFLGSGITVYGTVFTALLEEQAVCVDSGLEGVGVAESIARIGRARFALGSYDKEPLEPLYIRSADARLPHRTARRSGD